MRPGLPVATSAVCASSTSRSKIESTGRATRATGFSSRMRCRPPRGEVPASRLPSGSRFNAKTCGSSSFTMSRNVNAGPAPRGAGLAASVSLAAESAAAAVAVGGAAFVVEEADAAAVGFGLAASSPALSASVISTTRPSAPVPRRNFAGLSVGSIVQSSSAGGGALRSVSTGPATRRPSDRVARPLRLRLGTSRKKSMSAFFESGSARALDASQGKTTKGRRSKRRTGTKRLDSS